MVNMINDDCINFMESLTSEFYDLAIVDPPYGINAGKKKQYHAGALTTYKPKKWDSETPNKKYFDQLFRISKNQIIWGANYFTQYLPPVKNWIVWDKKQPQGVTFSMHELAFYSGTGQAMIIKQVKAGNNVSNNKDMAKQYIRIHPTQKPVELYRWLLKNYAKPGDRIIDTHGGSGSICIACDELGFNLEWIERDPDYFNAAYERFHKHKMQLRLI